MRRWLTDAEYAYINSPAFLRSPEWALARQDAFRHWDGRCECCTLSRRYPGARFNVDHIKPRAVRPDLALDVRNLQVLCSECNRLKGNRTHDFRSKWHPYRITWWRRLWKWTRNKSI